MKIFDGYIEIDTKSPMEFIDITDKAEAILRDSGISNGMLVAFCNHTTACLKITEKCDRLQSDMMSYLERAIPPGDYHHDEGTVDGRPNARMHIMAMHMNASEAVPVENGRLILGTWQSLFFIELDGPRRKRKISVKVFGL
jgi:secondary thiamine-phosphate synthase enzyme